MDDQRLLEALELTIRALELLASGNVIGAKARLDEARKQIRALRDAQYKKP